LAFPNWRTAAVSDAVPSRDEAPTEAIAILSNTLRSHTRVAAPLDDANGARAGVAWTIRVLRTAEAVAELHHLGLGDTAAPLVRSVMEHAMSMQWLVERRSEAVKAIEYGHRQHQRRLRDAAAAHGWDLVLDQDIATGCWPTRSMETAATREMSTGSRSCSA